MRWVKCNIIDQLTVKIQKSKKQGIINKNMRYQYRNQQINKKQNLKSTLKLYHPPQQNQPKSKPSPCIGHPLNSKIPPYKMSIPNINFNHMANVNSNGIFTPSMEENYKKLYRTLQKQFVSFDQACHKIRQMTHSYYDELIKIVKANREIALNQVEATLKEAQKKFAFHIKVVSEVTRQLQCGHTKKSMEQINSQFNQLSVLEVPVFRIEGNPIKEFEGLIEQLRPRFISGSMNKSQWQKQQKENISVQESSVSMGSIKQSHLVRMKKSGCNGTYNKQYEDEYENENTIKKSNYNNYYSTGNNSNNIQNGHTGHNGGNGGVNKNICEFSCEEEFEWNPDDVNSHKYDKKQIVSEIILEEPSSCEDSLMLNQIP